jgi:hypothetical protein
VLLQKLKEADALRLPALKNMKASEPLGPFLLGQPLLEPLGHSIDGAWIGRLLEQLGEVIDKTKRIHFRSLGGILTLQEQIAEQWAAAHAAPLSHPG